MTTNYREAILSCPRNLSEFEKFPSSRMNKEQEKNLKTVFEIKEQNPKLIFGMDSQHRPYLWNYYTLIDNKTNEEVGRARPTRDWSNTRLMVISEFGSYDILFPNNYQKIYRHNYGHKAIAEIPDKQKFIEQIIDKSEIDFNLGNHHGFSVQNAIFIQHLRSPSAVYTANIRMLSNAVSETIAKIDENHFVYKNKFIKEIKVDNQQRFSIL